MRLKYIFICLFALACGADQTEFVDPNIDYDEAPLGPDPEWWDGIGIRIDGAIGDAANAPDVGFQSDEEQEAYCGANPDAAACASLYGGEPTEVDKAWKNAEFHGKRIQCPASAPGCVRPCYYVSTTPHSCRWPKYKQQQFFNGFSSTASACAPGGNVSSTESLTILEGFQQGALMVTGPGFGVDTASHTYRLTAKCTTQAACDDCAGYFAQGNISFDSTAPNPAIGPVSGIDPTGGNKQWGSSEMFIAVDAVERAWRETCGHTDIAILRRMAQAVGLHEALHSMGFGHFQTGPMGILMCNQPAPFLPSQLSLALQDYNGTPGGETVTNRGLNSFTPTE